MSSMTGDEFKKLRAGDTTAEELDEQKQKERIQTAIDAMNTKDFLIGRTIETVQVPISGLGGTKNIEIRARLSKSEMKQHEAILNRMNILQRGGEEFIRDEDDEHDLAVFLAHITTDDNLSAEFWLSEDIDPAVVDIILMEYFVAEPARRLAEIKKFLRK